MPEACEEPPNGFAFSLHTHNRFVISDWYYQDENDRLMKIVLMFTIYNMNRTTTTQKREKIQKKNQQKKKKCVMRKRRQ
jgi:hypothetical protein